MDLTDVDWVEPDEAIRLFHKAADELGPGMLKY